MKWINLMMGAFVIVGCTHSPKMPDHQNLPKQVIKFQSKNASVAEIAECHKQGGVVQQVGMLGFDKCIMTYPDAGKTCTKGDDCHSGTCELTFENSQNIIAPMTGVCKADNNPFGCRSFIESGQVQTICVD